MLSSWLYLQEREVFFTELTVELSTEPAPFILDSTHCAYTHRCFSCLSVESRPSRSPGLSLPAEGFYALRRLLRRAAVDGSRVAAKLFVAVPTSLDPRAVQSAVGVCWSKHIFRVRAPLMSHRFAMAICQFCG